MTQSGSLMTSVSLVGGGLKAIQNAHARKAGLCCRFLGWAAMGTDPPTVQFPGHPQGVSPRAAGPGDAWHGRAKLGPAGSGKDSSGRGAFTGVQLPGAASPYWGRGSARRGMAWIGTARQGSVRLGLEQRAGAQQGSIPCRCLPLYGGKAGCGLARQGQLRPGMAGRGTARAAKAARRGFGLSLLLSHGAVVAGHGQAQQGMDGLGGARCGLAWPGQRQQGCLGTVQLRPVACPSGHMAWQHGVWPVTARRGTARRGQPALVRREVRSLPLVWLSTEGSRRGLVGSGEARQAPVGSGEARKRRAGAERGSIPRRRLAPSGARGKAGRGPAGLGEARLGEVRSGGACQGKGPRYGGATPLSRKTTVLIRVHPPVAVLQQLLASAAGITGFHRGVVPGLQPVLFTQARPSRLLQQSVLNRLPCWFAPRPVIPFGIPWIHF